MDENEARDIRAMTDVLSEQTAQVYYDWMLVALPGIMSRMGSSDFAEATAAKRSYRQTISVIARAMELGAE